MKRSIEERKIKYVFYYLLTEDEVYAYADTKELSRGFEQTRDMERFYRKVVWLSSKDLERLHEEESGKRLLLYKFPINDGSLDFPITLLEKITIERAANQAAFIDIYRFAELPMEIFTEDVQKALRILEYDKAHRGWVNGIDETTRFEPDLLATFLKYYGLLMKLT
jgi:hypothetical protein